MRATAFCLCLFMLMSCQNNSGDVADNGEPTKDGGDPGDVIDVEEEILPPMPCIEDWPEFPEVAPVPSLTKTDGEWGDIIWRKELGWQSLRYPIAFDGEHLALTGGNKLWILDTSGNITGEFPEFTSMIGSAPVADGKGNFLFATQGLFSVTAKGEQRWVVPFGKNISSSYETTETSSILLSPDGVAYIAATDGFLHAINSETGMRIWKKNVGLKYVARPLSIQPGGVANFLFTEDNIISSNGEAYSYPVVDGHSVLLFPGFIRSNSLVASYSNSTYEKNIYILDNCGNRLWEFPEDSRINLNIIGFNDTSWISSGRELENSAIYSSSGEILISNKKLVARPRILGADGIAYAISCMNNSSGENILNIIAYNSNLQEAWKRKYDIACSDPSAALDDNGNLYIAYNTSNGKIEIVAVKTGSPGLANTAWPTTAQNNRRTGWLAPEQ